MALKRFHTQSVTSATTGSWITLRTEGDAVPLYSCNVIISGTATAKVQYTLDDDLTSPNIIDDATLASLTASTFGTVSTPIKAIRINCTAYTSGTVTLEVRQA